MKLSLIFASLLITITFLAAMNTGLVSYREKELAYNLDVLSHRQDDRGSMGLVGRYQIIRQRMEQGSESEEDYLLESRLQGVLTSIHQTEEAGDSPAAGESAVEPAVKMYLRGVRAALGKQMIEDVFTSHNDQLMELAYFYERYRNYGKALEVMDSIAKRRKNLDSYTRRMILLHSGFCHALLSNHEAAKESYASVIRYYGNTEEASIARILLGYLDAINDGAKLVMSQRLAENEKAEKLYLLSRYGDAMKLYGNYFKTAPRKTAEYSRAKFYYARAAEETGNRDTAVAHYRELVKSGDAGEWARKSSQRLIILGTFYRGGAKQGQASAEKEVQPGNDEFSRKIGKIQSKVSEERFAAVRAEENFREFITTNKAVNVAITQKTDRQQVQDIGQQLMSPGAATVIASFREAVDTRVIVQEAVKKEGEPASIQITTKDGFFFEGDVLHENEREITIRTEFGDIAFNRDQINAIDKTTR